MSQPIFFYNTPFALTTSLEKENINYFDKILGRYTRYIIQTHLQSYKITEKSAGNTKVLKSKPHPQYPGSAPTFSFAMHRRMTIIGQVCPQVGCGEIVGRELTTKQYFSSHS